MDSNEQDQARDEESLKPRDASHMADAEQPSNSEPAGDLDKKVPAKASSTPGAEICQTPQKHFSFVNELQKKASFENSIPITAPALSKLREGLEDAEGARRILTPSTSKLLAEAESLLVSKKPSANKSKRPLSDPSTLGTVARQFLNLLKSSPDGTLDIIDATKQLKVHRRRIYDICHVLEGVGLVVKESKNTIYWSGHSQTSRRELQADVGNLVAEQAMLEQWISRFQRLPVVGEVAPSDIVQALYKPRDGSSSMSAPPEDSILAIHAPLGSVVQVTPSYPGEASTSNSHTQLYVTTHADVQVSASSRRKRDEDDDTSTTSMISNGKRARRGIDDNEGIEVYMLPTKVQLEDNTVVSTGARSVTENPCLNLLRSPQARTGNSSSTLRPDEGASDFF